MAVENFANQIFRHFQQTRIWRQRYSLRLLKGIAVQHVSGCVVLEFGALFVYSLAV